MKKLGLFIFSIMLFVFVAAGCSSEEDSKKDTSEKKSDKQTELTVSAAASLQDALNDLKETYEKEHKDVKVNFNFGGSGALQQQISQGAPADLFFSAAEDKFDVLVDEGLIEEKQGTDLVGNELVVVVPKGEKLGVDDITDASKLALGTPDSVPAGQYGKQTLEKIGYWDEVEDNVVYAKDVRQVLTYVESENVDAGMVYKTDALTSSKVDIAATVDDKLHDPIVYPVGVIKDSKHSKEAKAFYEYLQSNEAMDTFEEYGFTDLRK